MKRVVIVLRRVLLAFCVFGMGANLYSLFTSNWPGVFPLALWTVLALAAVYYEYKANPKILGVHREGRKQVARAIIVMVIGTVIGLSVIPPHVVPLPVEAQPTINVVTGTKPSVDNLLKAVNQERAKVGVAPLAIDERLNKSAQTKAQDMKTRNYFGHVDPDGKQGYSYVFDFAPGVCAYASENIQDSKVESDNILEVDMSAWIHSPPHYAAMIDPKYSTTGFGITSTGLVEHFCELHPHTGTVCIDGWHSSSMGRGTCSEHGGVDHYL